MRDVLLEDLPPLCVSMVQRRDHNSAYLDLLRGYLMEVIGEQHPCRPGGAARQSPSTTSWCCPAPPQSGTAAPGSGTQLPFAGGNNFRELGGYEADEGKHVKWGQIYAAFPPDC